jgi:hypothetical protein
MRSLMSPVTQTKGVASGAPDQLAALSSEIAALGALDLHSLWVRWRKLFRSQAPPHLSKALLLRIIAYRIQAKAIGDLDRDTLRFLDRLKPQRVTSGKGPAQVPAVPAVPAPRGVKPGTIFVREHEGVVHQVMTMEKGFAWNGTSYRSLSEIARAITGTRWSGPRFFGLREGRRSNAFREEIR